MRVAAAHHHRIGLAWKVDIVGELTFPGHEHRVFAAQHRLPDREPVELDQCRIDEIIHASLLLCPIVTPAKAGVQGNRWSLGVLDSRFRGNDEQLL